MVVIKIVWVFVSACVCGVRLLLLFCGFGCGVWHFLNSVSLLSTSEVILVREVPDSRNSWSLCSYSSELLGIFVRVWAGQSGHRVLLLVLGTHSWVSRPSQTSCRQWASCIARNTGRAESSENVLHRCIPLREFTVTQSVKHRYHSKS